MQLILTMIHNGLKYKTASVHTGSLIVVDVDTLELQVRVTVVGACRVNSMLVWDHLPELHMHSNTSQLHQYVVKSLRTFKGRHISIGYLWQPPANAIK